MERIWIRCINCGEVIPEDSVNLQTITFDNGTEFILHDVPFTHCDFCGVGFLSSYHEMSLLEMIEALDYPREQGASPLELDWTKDFVKRTAEEDYADRYTFYKQHYGGEVFPSTPLDCGAKVSQSRGKMGKIIPFPSQFMVTTEDNEV